LEFVRSEDVVVHEHFLEFVVVVVVVVVAKQ